MKTTLQVFKLRVNKSCSFTDFIVLLNEKLVQKGYQNVFVFTDVQSETVKKEIEDYGAEITVIKNKWDSFSFAKQLFDLVKKYDPQIIDFHFCSSITLVPLLAWLRIFKRRIKLIFHYHGEIIPIQDLRFKNKHFSRLRILTFFFHKIVTVSKANERFLRALNIKKDIKVIYNGISLNNFSSNDTNRCRREYNIPENDLILTSVSTLIPRKGLDILLKALAKVINVIKNVKIIIVGKGPLEGMCKQLVQDLGIRDHVIFTGFLEEFPYHILSGSDVYVSASNSESFGIVYAEAMALGVPVVATNVGGIPEVVSNGITGLLVAPRDENALSEAIINLIENKERRQEMGLKGRMRVEAMFNLENRVRDLVVKGYNL
jgi:glycosyltransferase involved in cell wall biosynthesis